MFTGSCFIYFPPWKMWKKVLLSLPLFSLSLLLILIHLIYGSASDLTRLRLYGNSPYQKEVARRADEVRAIKNQESRIKAWHSFNRYFPSEAYLGLFGLAKVFYLTKEYGNAIEYFTKAMNQISNKNREHNNLLAVLYINRGHSYARLGEFDKAISDYKTGNTLSEYIPESLYNIKILEKHIDCKNTLDKKCNLNLKKEIM